MKLSKYIKKSQEILDEHGDLDLIYTSDDEANNFCRGVFSPSIRYINDNDNEYNISSTIDEVTFKELEEEDKILWSEKVCLLN